MPRMRRRTTASFIIGVLAALILAAIPVRAETDEALRIVTRDTAAIGGPALSHAAGWTAKTGRPVEVQRLPFDQLYARTIVPLLSGAETTDVLLIPAGWLGDFAPYLAPVPETIRGTLRPEDILPPYRDLGRIPSGEYVAVPIDGDMHIGAYRADLFRDPAVRAGFRRWSGHELEPPATWEEYLRIAAFFDGRPGPDGRRLRGTVEAFHPAGQRIWSVFSHVAAYAVHREAGAAMFFDPETMASTIDTPGWVRGVKEYLQARDRAGPDANELHSADVRRIFAEGGAAMAIDWTDIGPLSAGTESAIPGGEVGFFPLPGTRETWNPARNAWERQAEVWRVPYLAFGGWVAAVPMSAAHRDAAWDYVSWLASPSNSARDVLDGYSGINPYRRSHLVDLDVWSSALSRTAAQDYLRVISEALDSPSIALDLRLPGTAAYLDALDRQIGRALAGEVAVETALRTAAAEWDFLTDRLGRGAQRRHYRSAMGMPE
jgi:multiple sugar transport system substrate-binding protein